MAEQDLVRSVFGALAWVGIVVSLATAVAAVVRLRASLAGVLLGGSFAALALLSLASKGLRALAPGEPMIWGVLAIDAVRGLLQGVAAVGLLLVPWALKRLRDREAGVRPAPR